VKIRLSSPSSPETTVIHTEGHDVVITEAFVGPLLRTGDGEELGICMRDSGFELVYDAGYGRVIHVRLNAGECLVENRPRSTLVV
jgi:hypothetical protein